MNHRRQGGFDGPVLVLTPSSSDAVMVRRVLETVGIHPVCCDDMADLCRRIDEHTGAAIIVEEALGDPAREELARRLAVQPAWSDIPLIVLLSSRRETAQGLGLLDGIEGSTHLTLLRRPLHRSTLVSSVRAALEARRRQIAIRDELRAREQREAELEESRTQLAALTRTLEERVRKRTELAVRRADGLRRLAAQLGEAERVERERLAELLHDGLQQLLLGARMQVAPLRGKVPDEFASNLDKLDEILKTCIRDARSLSHELSPPVLHNTDLARMFEWLAEWFGEHHGLKVEVRVAADAATPAEETRVFLFSAARELLVNAIKHSGSMEAAIDVWQEGSELLVEVTDGGRHFDATEVERALERKDGFGLVHIQDRVDALGGRLDVSSTPRGGGRFRFVVPLGRRTVASKIEGTRSVGTPDLVRVLIADEHEVVREGLSIALDEQPDLDVVGEVVRVHDLVPTIERLAPDVVVVDRQLLLAGGRDLVSTVAERCPRTRWLAISVIDDPVVADDLLELGAHRFVSKRAPTSVLLRAIRELASTSAGDSRTFASEA